MRRSKLMFAMLALLVNGCAVHARKWSDWAIGDGLLDGARGGTAGSLDVGRPQPAGTSDERAAGAGPALGPVVSAGIGPLHSGQPKGAPPPAEQAPSATSETVEVQGPRLDPGRAMLKPEGNGLWLRPSVVLSLLDEADHPVRSRKKGGGDPDE
jgi:hypothetical protein